jgi:hypothetical protein
MNNYPVPSFVSIHELIKRDAMTEPLRESLYALLASGCRQKNRELLQRRIWNHLGMLPNHGILNRLYVDLTRDADTFHYCAGQSYPDEIRTVRKIFLDMR